ncbi:MAG: hypothetical protein A2136_06455 [Chloroflexi bacterium RBG_16_54_11]|nr:MAG: hypothetical protein A2136_06455 [Chloroflexi bacterium RBG_16_54_11]
MESSSQPADTETIQVIPASIELWSDIEQLFARSACWCQYWRLSSGEYGHASKGNLDDAIRERSASLSSQLERQPPPGMLAYLDDQVAGWCGFGIRGEMQRLVRSRTIPAVDDRPVWSIVCFLVRTGFRRRGVARALLQGVITYARRHGAPALEAYPVDPGSKRIDTAFAYVGTVAMFEQAGFQRVLETSAHSAGLPRWLMRLEFVA